MIVIFSFTIISSRTFNFYFQDHHPHFYNFLNFLLLILPPLFMTINVSTNVLNFILLLDPILNTFLYQSLLTPLLMFHYKNPLQHQICMSTLTPLVVHLWTLIHLLHFLYAHSFMPITTQPSTSHSPQCFQTHFVFPTHHSTNPSFYSSLTNIPPLPKFFFCLLQFLFPLLTQLLPNHNLNHLFLHFLKVFRITLTTLNLLLNYS